MDLLEGDLLVIQLGGQLAIRSGEGRTDHRVSEKPLLDLLDITLFFKVGRAGGELFIRLEGSQISISPNSCWFLKMPAEIHTKIHTQTL